MIKILAFWLLTLTAALAQPASVSDVFTPLNISGYPGNGQVVQLVFPTTVPTSLTAVTYYLGTVQPLPADRQPTLVVAGQTATITYPMPRSNLDWTAFHEITWEGRANLGGVISANRNVKNTTPSLRSLNVVPAGAVIISLTVPLGQKAAYEVPNYAAAKALAVGPGRFEVYILADETNGGADTYYDYAPNSSSTDHLTRRVTN